MAQSDIAIVGGGPSGIYCALWLLKKLKEASINDFKLTIFDKAQILRTILPTGNGRCNITNANYDTKDFISNYPRGQKFLHSIFSKHFNYDTIDFFNSIGVETYIQDDLRVFPKSNSAADVKNKMLNDLKKYKNVRLVNKEITDFSQLDEFNYKIISVGSKGDLPLLKTTKHNLIPFKKALCALKIENMIYPKGVSVQSLDGDFVFSESGFSGPLAFKISSINAYKKMPYEIEINLFDYNILADLAQKFPKKSIGNLVSTLIPRSLAKVIVKDFNKNSAEISNELIKSYSKLILKIVSTAQIGEIVNAGGIDLNELTNSCKSKIQNNLWFCGEVLDIDGFCGGFNLQNCWSTAYVVANDVACSIIK